MQNPDDSHRFATFPSASRRLPILAAVLFCITVASIFYVFHERSRVRELTASRDQIQAALARTSAQVGELSAKVTALAAPRPEPAVTPAGDTGRPRRAAVVRVPPRRAADDPRWKKVEGRLDAQQKHLDEQQKQLASTQADLQKSREDLQGKLDSTRTELSGSIARNHDELVELQKRGERNYYEFDVAKSKQFQRTGPISLSVRKTDAKHKRFDLALLVEDAQIEKKRVNLYEPVLIYLPDRPQPVELVANQITKTQVKGYLSEPKYKKSELATTAAAPVKSQEPALRQR